MTSRAERAADIARLCGHFVASHEKPEIIEASWVHKYQSHFLPIYHEEWDSSEFCRSEVQLGRHLPEVWFWALK